MLFLTWYHVAAMHVFGLWLSLVEFLFFLVCGNLNFVVVVGMVARYLVVGHRGYSLYVSRTSSRTMSFQLKQMYGFVCYE
jgi:hypothetical protein